MDEKDISLRIARLRNQKGVSAREMSLSIGQNTGYINSIEAGKSMPSIQGLLYICEYLGVTPNEFFEMDSVNPRKLNRVANDMKKLTETQLDAIWTIVKELTNKK